ncbi:unnamed protein product [Ectocarpus fasciculatus]
MANNVDIAGPCPRCGLDSLILACSDTNRSFSYLPMCLDINRCQWTGIMLTEPHSCSACDEVIPAGSPACTTRVYANNPHGLLEGLRVYAHLYVRDCVIRKDERGRNLHVPPPPSKLANNAWATTLTKNLNKVPGSSQSTTSSSRPKSSTKHHRVITFAPYWNGTSSSTIFCFCINV